MKQTLCFLPLVLGALLANGQGLVNFANNHDSLVINGNAGEPLPVGSSFLAGLYYADDGILDESVYVQLGAPASFPFVPGIFSGGARTAPTPVPGGFGMFQVRVWEAAFGTTYEEAVASLPQQGRFALVGKSDILRIHTSAPFEQPPAPTLVAWGLRGFAVVPVPEPSSFLLLFLTGAFILWDRAKRLICASLKLTSPISGIMKLVMVIMLLFALARNSFAQGEIAFVNSSQQPVLDFRTGEPVVAGNTFLAALYFAQDGIFDETQFVQVGSAADFWVPGVFNGGARTAPTAVRGGYGMFQVRAWESAFGSTYEQAVAAPPQNGRYALFGKSNIFRADTADPDHPTEPPTSILTYGFRSFYLIPEPNTVSLLALFTTALLFWRFRQGFE